MRARQVLGPVIALLVAVAFSPAAQAARPPQLAGVTVITANSRNTHMRVELTRTIDLEQTYVDMSYVSISGTADIVVVYLVPKAPRPLLHELVKFGRLPAAAGHRLFAAFPEGVARITAGQYNLVVVHTSGTAKITLRLSGLHGSTVLRPTSLSSATVRPLTVQPVGGVLPPVGSSGGATGVLTQPGQVEVAAELDHAVGAATVLGGCLQDQTSLTADPVAFLPGCPGASAVNSVAVQRHTNFQDVMFPNRKGRTEGGFTYETSGTPLVAAGLVAWVPYDEP